MKTPPKLVPKRWIRNKADELAVAAGMRFDPARGQFVCDWIEANCWLFEGICEPVKLLDWHRDFYMRLFSWVYFSEDWDCWIRRFTEATVFAGKKSAKSPLIAHIGLYMLYGDSEPGPKICIGATKFDQAALSQKHALKTVEKSPELNAVCKVNQTTKAIICEARDGWMGPIASDNKGAEGLNANCICIDELHCIDEVFADVLRGATISRKEPLTIRISTAGVDIDTYGGRVYKQGKADSLSEKPPLHKLFIDYSAPQDLRNDELEKNFEKYAKLANPAYGITPKAAEIRKDYEDSKNAPSTLSRFKRYRLGIWPKQGANALIPDEVWAENQYHGSAEKFFLAHKRMPCVAALDLSIVNDFSAACYAFKMPDGFIDMAFRLWMPERTIARYSADKPELLEWAKDGDIIQTPGETLDYNFILTDFGRLSRYWYARELAYDPMYAHSLAQQIAHGYVDDHGEVKIEGIGCRRVEFRQTYGDISKPISDFEKLCLDRKLRVLPNACVTWQIGNAQAKEDPHGNRRLEKSEGWKKIDACLAAVMATARILLRQTTPSISVL